MGHGQELLHNSNLQVLKSELLGPLEILGFEMLHISADKITGCLHVNNKCIQPFKVLHGGVSALIAESLAGIGAHFASGMQRVAGLHLSIDHLKPAMLDDLVFAEGIPISVGKIIQVWEIRLYKVDRTNEEKRNLISTSRVTILVIMHKSKHVKGADEALNKLTSKL